MSKLDLRSFQKELSERLAAVRRTGGESPRLTFSAGGASYALPLTEVTEVAPMGSVRAVPGAQAWYMGLSNVRGAVIGLTHLGALLHNGPVQANSNSRILVLGGPFAKLRAGFLVDSVTGLRTISTAETTNKLPWADQEGRDQNGALWSLLNIHGLLQSTAFLSIAHSQS
jgi:twitching motility protein PilI